MSDESLEQIAQIMATNQGVGRSRPLATNADDCDFNLDDFDSAYWEDYLGGPDDSEFEKYYEDLTEILEVDYCDESKACEATDWQQEMGDEAEMEVGSRIEQIIYWLSESKLAIKIRDREGFCVLRGPVVRLNDGIMIDLFEWLSEEGITGGSAIAGYTIIHPHPKRGHRERLVFFRVVVDAPFSRLLRKDQVQEHLQEHDDDIPF